MVLNVVYAHLVAGVDDDKRKEFNADLHAPLGGGGESEVAPWLTALMDEADEETGEAEE